MTHTGCVCTTLKNLIFSGLYYALINLNLETNSIVQIQKDLQKQYLEVLLKTYAELFNSIIDKDDFTPLVVSSQEEEFEILQAFPLNAGELFHRNGDHRNGDHNF